MLSREEQLEGLNNSRHQKGEAQSKRHRVSVCVPGVGGPGMYVPGVCLVRVCLVCVCASQNNSKIVMGSPEEKNHVTIKNVTTPLWEERSSS